jgi:dynein heavy chain
MISALLVYLQASTLGNWFTGLLQRHDQLGKWLTLGRPRAYWMTGFFNPQVSSFFDNLPLQCPAHVVCPVTLLPTQLLPDCKAASLDSQAVCCVLQGFLTAVKQEVNRKHAADKWALDDVVMTSEVTHPSKVGPINSLDHYTWTAACQSHAHQLPCHWAAC